VAIQKHMAMIVCVKCRKKQPEAAFRKQTRKGVETFSTRCVGCLEKAKAYRNGPKGIAAKQRHVTKMQRRTEEEKAEVRQQETARYHEYKKFRVLERIKLPEVRAKRKVYRSLPRVKASEKRYNQSDARARSIAKHKKTEKFRLSRERAKKSLATALATARNLKRRKEELGRRLLHNIRNRIAHCIKRQEVDEDSVSFTYTEFASGDDAERHFESCLKPGMRMHNYGWFWSVAHKIPCFWYDFSNPEDIRRANSKANLGCDYELRNPFGELTNNQKKIALPTNQELLQQGTDSWPVLWNGTLPTPAFQKAMKAKQNKKVNVAGVVVQAKIGHFFSVV